MRTSVIPALLLGGAASTAAAQDQQKLLNNHGNPQQPLSGGGDNDKSWWANLESIWGDASAEMKATWDEVSLLVPGAFDEVVKYAQSVESWSPPVSTTRRPESEWDVHIKGAEVGDIQVEADDGKLHKVGGDFSNYGIRARTVDPSVLGVDTVKQYSGYLDAYAEDKHLFFWFFESRNDPENDPVILWINGGPGCSSMVGLFFELGPARVNEKLEVVHNPHSWNSNASVIFLEQPVGVGYSYSSKPVTNTPAAAKDVYALLSLFFHKFPQYGKQDFHFAGESYGGHYVPSFVAEILSHEYTNINLKSALVGNGLSDTLTQYPYYKPYACDGAGGYEPVLDEKVCKTMEDSKDLCQSLIQRCYDSESSWSCVPAYLYCNSATIDAYMKSGKNPYDIRDDCHDEEHLCYTEVKYATEYLNKPEVQAAVGAEVDTYASCNWDVNRNFILAGDWMKPIYRHHADILERQVPTLIYAGDADFICNWLGVHAWTEALEWSHKDDFNKAEFESVYLQGRPEKPYARAKSSHNFTFFQLFEAGHLVPHDTPAEANDMINRWIRGEWFA